MEKELILTPGTLITSKTDLKGKITYCNKDFLRYALYEEEELLNKPHNIIRHPDMPKAVFKLLWDYIQNGKEIFAFVKNRNKYGDFYWVFANITPSYNASDEIIGYYSVRRKPNPKAIEQISDIYAQMIQIEKTDGISGGVSMVEELCKNLGKSYNQIVFEMQKDLK
ncbi:PAS domain-containing protein [Helicobacter cappadocius]|uniref:PAS domain-containing protein n=1 Tax=Helicobacter cappadocius TaxID=3063998 RepID=A0AA90PSW5_9HELI|nr:MULTISPECIES: PAS domain-containing protein [unclassified Helicobacter]MDO7253634.1 PAS domain-containing protein [Helicobacter sp. faydin-H75]MDP2539562.1 PAS domain-containing protein [Helicobacter sp. faydin-H76]